MTSASQPSSAVKWWVLAGGALLLLALPPVDWWWLGWVAALPWLRVVASPAVSRRTYGALWLAAFLVWLVVLEGIRRAHPLLVFGWLTLAAYLACYTPLFIAVARVLVHRRRWPLVLAAPVTWVAMEYLRSTLLGGFGGALLAHTQAGWPLVLQLADVGGAYLVSGLMIVVAAAAEPWLPWREPPPEATSPAPAARWLAPLLAALALAAICGYGGYRLSEAPPGSDQPPLRVALIQGSLDTVFDTTAEAYWRRVDRTLKEYARLTEEAVAQHAREEPETALDLVVWPESAFPIPERNLAGSAEGQDQSAVFQTVLGQAVAAINAPQRAAGAGSTGAGPANPRGGQTRFLFGCTTLERDLRGREQAYNSALLAGPDGKLVGRYYKMQLVMFGEFVPGVAFFPGLADATPIGSGLSAGAAPAALAVGRYRLSPSICFESFSPDLIGGQVRELRRRGVEPDFLVNGTNDGWFWGSAILDLHLRCGVLRAVEQRKPLLVAANTGFSAVVDGNGRVRERGPRRAPAILLAAVTPDGRRAIYSQWGDWFALGCTTLAWLAALAEVAGRPGPQRQGPPRPGPKPERSGRE